MKVNEFDLKGFDKDTASVVADIKARYPHAPDAMTAILKYLSDIKTASKSTSATNAKDIDVNQAEIDDIQAHIKSLQDRVEDLEKDEDVTERELTKGEEKKKEKIVKGMKKNKGDFEKRYGKDAKAVMYATATKMAKGESMEEDFTYTSHRSFGMFSQKGDAIVGNIIQQILDKFFDDAVNVTNSERDSLRMDAFKKLFQELEELSENEKYEEAMDTDVREQAAAYMDKGINRIYDAIDKAGNPNEGYEILPPMDKEKYQERPGLEGPIMTRSGKVVYYDNKEGSYYDPDTDMYISYDDWKKLDSPNMHKVEAVKAPGKAARDTGAKVVAGLEKIVDTKSATAIKFNDGTTKVDLFTASMLMNVYNAVNDDNKKKLMDLMSTRAGFMKAAKIAFSMSESKKMKLDNLEENRLGFKDIEKFGKEMASKIDIEARRRGSADMEPGKADELRYKIAKEMGLVESALTEGVLDDTDEDGWMAKSQLYKTAKYAIKLHGMISDTDNLEPWVQAKITKAADYLSAVKHYMEYEMVNPYPMATESDDRDDIPFGDNEMSSCCNASIDGEPYKGQGRCSACGEMADVIKEAEEKHYMCAHAKKGTMKCTAGSSYEAAKKAAAHWGMSGTAGIDAHLMDQPKTATEGSYGKKKKKYEGHSPHKKGSAKYKKHMAAKHASMAEDKDSARMYKDNPDMMKKDGPGGYKGLNKAGKKAVKKAMDEGAADQLERQAMDFFTSIKSKINTTGKK